jgi:hypothetical protein
VSIISTPGAAAQRRAGFSLPRRAVLAFAAAELETTLGALPGLMPPLHRHAAAQAALDGCFGFLDGHDL